MREEIKDRGPILAGGDVGTLCTKVVIIDAQENIISFYIMRSGAIFKGTAEACMTEALRSAGLEREDISYIVATGYGRAKVPFADSEVTEITCHGRGAKRLFPEVHTIIDIGGQDSKVIYVNDEGQLLNFVMNDKCAAGTGRFLEVMTSALEVALNDLGKLSLTSKMEVKVSSMCTVFAESEVISLKAAGCDTADIAASVHRSISRRITGMVAQLGVKERVVMTGGVAKNIGVVRALEDKLRTTLLVPEEPQIIGAWGAALIAAESVT